MWFSINEYHSLVIMFKLHFIRVSQRLLSYSSHEYTVYYFFRTCFLWMSYKNNSKIDLLLALLAKLVLSYSCLSYSCRFLKLAQSVACYFCLHCCFLRKVHAYRFSFEINTVYLTCICDCYFDVSVVNIGCLC